MQAIQSPFSQAHIDSSCGVSKTPYFLFQVDITEDGVGQADFQKLKLIFKQLEFESNTTSRFL